MVTEDVIKSLGETKAELAQYKRVLLGLWGYTRNAVENGIKEMENAKKDDPLYDILMERKKEVEKLLEEGADLVERY